MRQILSALMLLGTAHAQLPDGINLSQLPLKDVSSSALCKGLLNAQEARATTQFSFPGKRGTGGCLQGKTSIEDVRLALWNSGFDLGVASYPLLEKMDVWQKLGGTQGLVFLYSSEEDVLTLAWTRLDAMASAASMTLFHPQVGFPFSAVPSELTSDDFTYNAGTCFDGPALLANVVGSQKATLLHHGCQQVRTSVRVFKDSLAEVMGFVRVNQAEGKNRYVWIGKNHKAPGHHLYLNLQPDTQDPAFVRVSWMAFKPL